MKRSAGVGARWLLALVLSAGLVISAQALVSPLPGSIVALTLPESGRSPLATLCERCTTGRVHRTPPDPRPA